MARNAPTSHPAGLGAGPGRRRTGEYPGTSPILDRSRRAALPRTKYRLARLGNVSIHRIDERSFENALTLDVNELSRRGVLARGGRTRGVISWLGAAGETAASVSYEADTTNADAG